MEKLSDTNPITEAKPDRRILKTKRAIYEALVELMQKKKLNSITVTELAAAANINRKTFYTYYSTVNDVLDEVINELISSLKDLMYTMSDVDIVRALFTSDNGNMLFNKLQKALQETLLKELIDNDIKMNIPPEQYPLISSFVAGGMIYVYYEWITNPNGTSLDEMARTLTTLIISGVHAFS